MSDTEDAVDIYTAHGSAKNGDDREKGSKAKGNQKAKDLSHVPCKFFKVGSCTAGGSCPFSHQEPGQPKDVCTWFVKGNCKFGHKCALAHVLPGQSMSMDRRNKKAAQTSVVQKEGSVKGDKGKANKTQSNLSVSLRMNNQGRNSLLTGSTAPTRILATSTRPPMSISKGMPVPAAPAPALNDTDFDDNIVRSTRASDSASTAVVQELNQETKTSAPEDTSRESTPEPIKRHSLLPTSIPSNPVRLASTLGVSSPPVDFGPVGSPPRSTSSASHLNNFSPSVSPRDASSRDQLTFPTSPFSAPSSRSLFMAIEPRGGADEPSMEGTLSNALESKRHIIGSLPISRPGLFGNSSSNIDDGNLEDFIPSSLSDLLTPGEQNRRMNRTASNHPTPGSSIPRPSVQDHHHRYSHSVPASSVVNDLKSIWSDPEPKKDAPFSTRPVNFNGGRGLSPSVMNPSGFNPSSFPGEDFSQAGLLSPSNASAAFLPGIHQHYATRTTASIGSLTLNDANNSRNQLGGLSSDFRIGTHNNAAQEPTLTAPPTTETFNIPRSMYLQSSMGLPIPSKATYTAPELPLSPSAKALQAHAPGQSLPQGLAAGYSRIHAQPPQPFPASINSGSALSPPPVELSVGSPDQLRNSTSPRTVTFDSSVYAEPDAGGLSSMFARYTYSAAVSGGNVTNQSPSSSAMSRRSSGRGWNSHVLSSPLSGPVLSNDDDLFAFDEEK